MKRFWSVELEETGWGDYTFTGNYEDCFHYCRSHGYRFAPGITRDGNGCRIVLLTRYDDLGWEFRDKATRDEQDAMMTLAMERRSPSDE